MKFRMNRFLINITLMFLVMSFYSFAQTNKSEIKDNIPHLLNQGTATQLIVNGKPFLMLAGEVGNSSGSDLNYMKEVWQKAVKMNLNTLLVPIYWELLEPKEGQFNFTLVDNIIESARDHDLKLVLLWFGTWKNSMSCYVPLWIKKDFKRFPRAREKDGKPEEILTPFSNANKEADAHAFAELMAHIREIDQNERTVIMVQVENEIGMIPDARDYCESANTAFNAEVPQEFIQYLKENKDKLTSHLYSLWEKNGFKTSGNWEEIFRKSLYTDEIFMAWHYAKYANYVAKAGKKEYSLPMYVNAALIRAGYKPGQYPSGGPLPHLFDIWKAGAPEIDFFSPDIYFPSFLEWSKKYSVPGNPLFIPEVGNNQSMANAFYAIAQLDAIGYSPFSIESAPHPDKIENAYDILSQLTPLIISNQGKGTMAGVLLDSASQTKTIKLGDYTFNFHHAYSWKYAAQTEGENPGFGGIIIMISPDEFYIAGRGLIVTFESVNNDSQVGIGSIDEGKFVDGKWVPGRRLNGDQTHQGRHLYLPVNTFSIQKVKLYKYK